MTFLVPYGNECERCCQLIAENSLLQLEIAELRKQIGEARANMTFFRSCALSGGVPEDGAEPYPLIGFNNPLNNSTGE